MAVGRRAAGTGFGARIGAVLGGGLLVATTLLTGVAGPVDPVPTAALAPVPRTPATTPDPVAPVATDPTGAGLLPSWWPVPPRIAPQRDWAPAATAAIRPGVLTETAGGGLCTSNFVFRSGERTFLGQAAHCAGTGPASEVDGCTSGTGPVGSAVVVRATDGTRHPARLAYSSWVTMQAGAEADLAVCAANDFALVELAPADLSAVSPDVPFFGGPTGLAARPAVGAPVPGGPAVGDPEVGDPAVGDEVFGYGSPLPRVDPAGVAAALRPRIAVVAGDTDGGLGHQLYAVPPGVPGDSGAGWLDADGRAIGLLSTLTQDPDGTRTDGLTDLAAALDYAAAHDPALAGLGLVLGTGPFTTEPPGVPATELAPPAGPPLG